MVYDNYRYENEVGIVWVKPEFKSCRYLREERLVTSRRKSVNVKRYRCGDRGIIAYSVLKSDASAMSDQVRTRFQKRIWYLANHDPYDDGGCPSHSVLPSSISEGKPSIDAYGNI